MKDYQKIYDEVSSYLLRESMNCDLPVENRIFICSMLVFIDTIIEYRCDLFEQVFLEVMEVEEAKKN